MAVLLCRGGVGRSEEGVVGRARRGGRGWVLVLESFLPRPESSTLTQLFLTPAEL